MTALTQLCVRVRRASRLVICRIPGLPTSPNPWALWAVRRA